MSDIYGEVAVPQDGVWIQWAAKLKDGEVTCYDLSGLLGSWKCQEPLVFFPNETRPTGTCMVAFDRARDFCRASNSKTKRGQPNE